MSGAFERRRWGASMFLMVSWVVTGAVLGSVGVAFIASMIAEAGGRRGGEVDLDSVFFWLALSTIIGAVGGGWLARKVRRTYADNPQRLGRFAIVPLLAVAALIAYAAMMP